jgi:hypothetical protein
MSKLVASLLILSLAGAGAVVLHTVGIPSETHRAADPGGAAAVPQDMKDLNPGYDGRFQFVRIQFTPGGRGGFGRGRGGREPAWAHDWPRAERNFMRIVDETTFVGPVVDASNILRLDDPDLLKYPLAYMVEVGLWDPSDEEVAGLSDYLRKGGFLFIDDFRGGWDLQNFEYQMDRVLPGISLLELDASHGIFDSFFRIDPHDVLPPYGGQYPIYFGIFEDNDRDKRLMAIVNYNTDIAEYWEYSDRGYYPIDLSNEAYKLGVNYIVYAMTH